MNERNRDYGTRRIGEGGGNPSSLRASGAALRANVHSELSVLRNVLRRMGLVGLRLYEAWCEHADADDVEFANDHVKPLLEDLCRILPAGKE